MQSDDRLSSITTLPEIERLKVLKAMRIAYPIDEEFNELICTIFPHAKASPHTLIEIRRRLHGLTMEDEFSILCRLMGHCATVTALEQTPMKERSLLAPDFLVNFNTDWDKTRCLPSQMPFMIEVKSQRAGKPKTLMSLSTFNKRKRYAEQFGIPLLIATRFHCENNQRFWLLQTEAQFLESKRKPSIDDWWEQSISHLLLGDWLVVNQTDTLIEFNFKAGQEPNHPTNSFVIDQIESINIVCAERSHTLDETNRSLFQYLDGFPQHLLAYSESKQPGIKIRRLMIKKGAAVPLSDLILRANESVMEANGLAFSSASRLLALEDTKQSSINDKKWALKSYRYFNDNVTDFKLIPSPNLNELKKRLIQTIK